MDHPHFMSQEELGITKRLDVFSGILGEGFSFVIRGK